MTQEREVTVTLDQWRRLTSPRRFSRMPFPDVTEIVNKESGEMIPAVRVTAKGFGGETKDFIWGDNCSPINVYSPIAPDIMAHIMTEVKLRDGNDSTWGPAIDIRKSVLDHGVVTISTKRGHYGFYVERGKHSFFTFREVATAPTSPEDLRKTYPEYDKFFAQAKALVLTILPRR